MLIDEKAKKDDDADDDDDDDDAGGVRDLIADGSDDDEVGDANGRAQRLRLDQDRRNPKNDFFGRLEERCTAMDAAAAGGDD
jgi:hypothetical protein